MSEPAERPRVVFNGNVLLQAATRENGAAAETLRLMQRHRLDVFLSRATLREIRDVFSYPEVRFRNPNLTDERVAEFLQLLNFHGHVLRTVPHVFDYARDPDDEMYIDLAVAGKADYLVSRDKDLLSLTRGYGSHAKRLRRLSPNLRIVTPEELLHVVRS
jgi:uncharacterized protein